MRGIDFIQADLPMPVTTIGLTGLRGVQQDVLIDALGRLGFAHHGFDLLVREHLGSRDASVADRVARAGGWEAALDGRDGTSLKTMIDTASVSRPAWEWEVDLFDQMAAHGAATGADDGFGLHVVTGIDTAERASWLRSLRGVLWGTPNRQAGLSADLRVPDNIATWSVARTETWIRQGLVKSVLSATFCDEIPLARA